MSDHLARLVARSTRPAGGGLRPLPSMFEQQPSPDPVPASVHAAEKHVRLPAAERSPRPTSPRGDVEVPAVVHGPPPDDSTPHPAQPRTAGARTQTKRPHELVPTVATPVRHGSESRAQVGPRGEPPLPEVEPSTPARPAVHEQVVALATADRLDAGLREAPVVDHRENEPPGSPQPLPHAVVPPDVPVRHEGRPRNLSVPDLPRLQPSSRAGQRSAAPEVTVSIGRIEVITPTPEPRKPPPERPPAPLRAPGAPKLADYLRERKSR